MKDREDYFYYTHAFLAVNKSDETSLDTVRQRWKNHLKYIDGDSSNVNELDCIYFKR